MNDKIKIILLTLVSICATIALLAYGISSIFSGVSFLGAVALMSGVFLFIGYPLNNITMTKRINAEAVLFEQVTKYVDAKNEQFITINCEGCNASNEVEVSLDKDEVIFTCGACGNKNRVLRSYTTNLITEIKNNG